MEELIQKLEKTFDQKLEVTYDDGIVIQSSAQNPPEMRDIELVFTDKEQAKEMLTTLLALTNGTQKTSTT